MSRLALARLPARLRLLWPGALLWWRLWLLLPAVQGGASPGVAAQSTFTYQALCRYTWEAVDPQKNVRYEINPCGGIDKCTKSSAVCATDIKTNNSFSVGDTSLIRNSKLLLEFNTTKPCPQQGSQPLQSSINFYCGKTLGSPEFVASTDCVHYFEWKTYVACKKDLFKPKKEVPCYVYDGLKKHDLNPLIKTSGAYLVDESEDDVELHINICRNIGLNLSMHYLSNTQNSSYPLIKKRV